MKTLDEAIKGIGCFNPLKDCNYCPYEEYRNERPGIGPSCIDVMGQDVSYYLHQYRKLLDVQNPEQESEELARG